MNSSSVRPVGVTVVAVLIFIQAALEAIGGAVFIAAGLNASSVTVEGTTLSSPILTTIGVVSMVVGVIGVLLGVGLLQGNRGARGLITVLQLISIVLSVIGFFLTAHGLLPGDLLSLGLAVLIIVLLWQASASAFFNAPKR